MGFQKGLSTFDALTKLTQYTIDGINSKNHIDCVALDLAKAFDGCWPETIIHQLKKWGLTGNIHEVIYSFLTNRRLTVDTGALKSSSLDVKFGVPQGSPLSALLFTVAIHELSDTGERAKHATNLIRRRH